MSNELATIQSWESVGKWIADNHPEIEEARQKHQRGTLAIGAVIVLFSERPEVKDEVSKANQQRRGRKWEPCNYVAEQLAQRFGDRLPSSKYMGDCARAAIEQRTQGLPIETSIRKILGWKEKSDLMPAKTTSGKKSSEPKARPDPEAYNEELVSTFGYIGQRIKEIAARKPRDNWSITALSNPQRERLQAHRRDINAYLRFLNMNISEVQSK